MPGKKFLLTGHAGFYNRGCEAIVKSTADLLRSKFQVAKIILYSGDYENDLRMINDNQIQLRPGSPHRLTTEWFMQGLIKHIPRFSQLFVKKFAALYYKADACLSIGGDNYTLDYGFPGSLLIRDQLAMRAGIPLIIWGASIGPFELSPNAKAIMKEHLRSVNLITARDSVTVEYLKSLGVTKNVVQVFDPAFIMKPETYSGPENDFIESGDIMGLNISALIAKWRTDKKIEPLINEIAGFVEIATAKGLKVLLVPHVIRNSRDLVVNDEAVLTMVMKQITTHRESVLILPGKLNACQMKWIISKCRFFIGARTHSTIASISSGVPTISIAYSQKAKGINQDIFGHENYVLETQIVSKENLRKKLNLLIENEETIRNLLSDKKIEMIHNAQKNIDALKDLLLCQ